jgi:formate dehydrogenase (NADP+) beta subunit
MIRPAEAKMFFPGLPVETPPSGKRILVVGAGPSGLSAAYHLERLGHDAEIREAGPLPGGMMHFGIPAYRMPRAKLMKEVKRIEEMGSESSSIIRSRTPSPQ